MGRTSRCPWGQSQLRALRTWFSGCARVVYHDYGPYRYYTTPLSLPSIYCAHLPVFPYCGICVSRVEELRLERNCLVVSFILSCICEGI